MSEIAISAVLVVVGLAALFYGANWLVVGSSTVARRLGISEMVIGLTIVAYGTSTPELAVSIAAALEGHADIVLGNVVGSNISNIGLIVGLSAVMLPIAISRTTIRREVPIMIGIALLLVALSIDGSISRIDGVLLLGGLVVFTYFIYARVKKERSSTHLPTSEAELKEDRRRYRRSFLLVGIGIGLLFAGSFITVDNAVIVAKSLGISERVIGLTIIAIGTSLPELVTSLVALRKGHAKISIGNIVGSNIYNILIIIGLSSTLVGITVNPAIYTDYLIMIIFSLAFLAMMRTKFVISRLEGYLLASAYIAYLVMLFISGNALPILDLILFT
ncbi:MAG: calcium/sodium antiporter [Nitrososphaerales archaeon]